MQMKFHYVRVFAVILLVLSSICGCSRNPKLENATAAVLHAFETHDVVILGEIHGNKQQHEWLRSLVATPAFADRVDDIVMEVGNSLYQETTDRYVSGQDVPLEQAQKAWRNVVGMIGPPSPVYESLYHAVRETNLTRRGQHQMRMIGADPNIDWEKITSREQIPPYLENREQGYTQIVKDEVLAKRHRALLIMGAGHFLRGFPDDQYSIEKQLRLAGAKTYVIAFGTNATGGYDDLDHRFDSWPAPVIVSLAGNWVGDLPTLPLISGGIVEYPRSPDGAIGPLPPGPALKLRDAMDALLYLGPRDSLTAVSMTRAELVGTPYGKEIERRLAIQGFPADFISELAPENAETPQFPRP